MKNTPKVTPSYAYVIHEHVKYENVSDIPVDAWFCHINRPNVFERISSIQSDKKDYELRVRIDCDWIDMETLLEEWKYTNDITANDIEWNVCGKLIRLTFKH